MCEHIYTCHKNITFRAGIILKSAVYKSTAVAFCPNQ